MEKMKKKEATDASRIFALFISFERRQHTGGGALFPE